MRVAKARALHLFFISPASRSSSFAQKSISNFSTICEFSLLKANNLSTSSTSSSSSASHQSNSQWRQHEEESKSVKVAVWWDFENCSVPNGVNAFRVSHRIISALRVHGIRGPVSITAFGDITRLSRSIQDALCASGVCLTHVPNSGKNSSDRSLLADLVYWVSHNPPPVHFFLISGDGDFANILHRLRMNNYNVLLAGGEGTSGALCSAATIMWLWNSLARGENLTGKHFNHPPDGIYGSWYGHFKGTLENPFPEIEQTPNPVLEEVIEPCIDTKPRQIPKALINAIRQLLSSHPEGISMSELRSELKRNNIVLEKDYFGHKKFSHLLLSMPNILKFKFNPGDAQPLVHGVHQKSAGQSESISRPNAEADGKSSFLPQKIIEKHCYLGNSLGTSISKDISESRERSPLHERTEGEVTDSFGDATKISYEAQFNKKHEDGNVAAEGIFRGLGKKVVGQRIEPAEESDRDAKINCVDPKNVDQCSPSISSVSGKEAPHLAINSVKDKENDLNSLSMPTNIGSASKLSFLGRIFEWFRFRKTDSRSSDGRQDDISQLNDYSVGKQGIESDGICLSSLDPPTIQPEPLNLFTKSHFWDSMESFLGTSMGLDIVSQSKTREELMRGLQKEGPLVLTALKDGHLHQLVNLLISEKKWVEESVSQAHPFKLMLPIKRPCIPSHSCKSNGLRSIFSDKKSRSDSELVEINKVPKSISELKSWFSQAHEAHDTPLSSLDYERWFEAEFGRNLEPSTYGYFTLDDLTTACSSEPEPGSCLGISRADTLSDCTKLLTDFLKHHPHGFNIGLFRPVFFKRYGYVLDYQALGYPKLASLLQIVPGVRIESSLVVPDKLEKKEEEQGGEKEQAWDELGPLSENLPANESEDPVNKAHVKNKGVSALLKVLDGYYSGPGENSGKYEGIESRKGRKISFVSDLKEEEETDKKPSESRLKSKFDALGI
ncbi:uncharacterized protein LOC144705726 [Wolffia australiana]